MSELLGKNGERVLVATGVVNAFLDAFGAYRSRGLKVVARHFGEDELSDDPSVMVPAGKLLAGMRELEDQFGLGFMTRIGRSIYEQAAFPPDLDTYASALAATDTAYYMNHANGDGVLGHYTWEPGGERDGRMICDNPYPCAFDQGIFSGMATQLGEDAVIVHDESEPCRRDGGARCAYQITW